MHATAVRLRGGQEVELRDAGPALAEERLVVVVHLRGVLKEKLRGDAGRARAEVRLVGRVARLRGGREVELRDAGPALAEEWLRSRRISMRRAERGAPRRCLPRTR